MNNHLCASLLMLSVAGACAMELQVVTEENTQNATTTLCTAIQNISHDANGVTAWAQLKQNLVGLTDSGERATIARTLHAVVLRHKNQAAPMLGCFGGEELFLPVVWDACSGTALGILLSGNLTAPIPAQAIAGTFWIVSAIGVNYVCLSNFVVKRKEQKALWKMVRDMKATAEELAPKEEV